MRISATEQQCARYYVRHGMPSDPDLRYGHQHRRKINAGAKALERISGALSAIGEAAEDAGPEQHRQLALYVLDAIRFDESRFSTGE